MNFKMLQTKIISFKNYVFLFLDFTFYKWSWDLDVSEEVLLVRWELSWWSCEEIPEQNQLKKSCPVLGMIPEACQPSTKYNPSLSNTEDEWALEILNENITIVWICRILTKFVQRRQVLTNRLHKPQRILIIGLFLEERNLVFWILKYFPHIVMWPGLNTAPGPVIVNQR